MTSFSENAALRDHWHAVAGERELDHNPIG